MWPLSTTLSAENSWSVAGWISKRDACSPVMAVAPLSTIAINLYVYVRNAPTMRNDSLGVQDLGAFLTCLECRHVHQRCRGEESRFRANEQIMQEMYMTPRSIMTGECRASGTLAAGTGGSISVAVNEKTGLSGQISIPMAAAGARVSASCGMKFRDPDAKDLKAAAGAGITIGIFSIDIRQTSIWPELYIGPAIGAGPEIKTPESPTFSMPLF